MSDGCDVGVAVGCVLPHPAATTLSSNALSAAVSVRTALLRVFVLATAVTLHQPV